LPRDRPPDRSESARVGERCYLTSPLRVQTVAPISGEIPNEKAALGRAAVYSEGGQSFIVTHSTAVNATISRIQPTLSPGAVVTTHKNLVDKVVTEHGVAELRGRTIRQRALALIAIAAPSFRDGLRAAARDLAYL
jgi:hypothetical protein